MQRWGLMMSSNLLLLAGAVGLIGCGVVRVLPIIKQWLPVKERGGRLHEIVDAYSLLHLSLVENGEALEAEHLRTKTLPSAIKPPGDL